MGFKQVEGLATEAALEWERHHVHTTRHQLLQLLTLLNLALRRLGQDG